MSDVEQLNCLKYITARIPRVQLLKWESFSLDSNKLLGVSNREWIKLKDKFKNIKIYFIRIIS